MSSADAQADPAATQADTSAGATPNREGQGIAAWLRSRNVTLEPMIAMVFIAHQIVGGAGITTDLMFLKVCSYEMGHNASVCQNLHLEEYADVQIDIQKRVNSFEITRDWIGNAPPMFFGLIAGALSDLFGRKPLIFWPLVGCIVSSVVPAIFYTFINVLPLEFMILEEFQNFLGGLGVYFVGTYSYGSSVTSTADRSIVLARYDGIESVAMIFGAGLSPTVFKYLGFYGNYAIRGVFYSLALCYLVFAVKEPVKDIKKVGKFKPTELPSYFYQYVVKSITDTVKTYFKWRPNNMRLVILVQISLYACYKFSNANFQITYLYMKLMFGAAKSDFALLRSVLKGLQGFALLVIMPVLSKVFGLHDTLIVAFCTLTNSLSLFSSAFMTDLWPFLFCRWGTFLRMCQYGAGRSLITRSVEPHEMGKALSGFPIVSSFVPYLAAPAMRYIYQVTMETFPSTYIMVAALLIFVASVMNLWLFVFHRNKFREGDGDDDGGEEQAADEKENSADQGETKV